MTLMTFSEYNKTDTTHAQPSSGKTENSGKFVPTNEKDRETGIDERLLSPVPPPSCCFHPAPGLRQERLGQERDEDSLYIETNNDVSTSLS
jgi:hypothetical protein